MRWLRPAWFALSVIALAGCNRASGKIVGTWRIDPASVKMVVPDYVKNNPMYKASLPHQDAQIRQTRLQFDSDGTVSMTAPGAEAQKGTWSYDGKGLIVNFETGVAKASSPLFQFDPASSRIHMKMGAAGGSIDMDLVKS